ncbi:TPA: hypothetical protein ACN322_004626, partial [Vibrio parahaemolyticus]
ARCSFKLYSLKNKIVQMEKYWFGSRVFDKNIDLMPCEEKIHGPYGSYEDAKQNKVSNRSLDIQQTPVIRADSEEEAKRELAKENWTTF